MAATISRTGCLHFCVHDGPRQIQRCTDLSKLRRSPGLSQKQGMTQRQYGSVWIYRRPGQPWWRSAPPPLKAWYAALIVHHASMRQLSTRHVTALLIQSSCSAVGVSLISDVCFEACNRQLMDLCGLCSTCFKVAQLGILVSPFSYADTSM